MRKEIDGFIARLEQGSYSKRTVKAYRYELERFVDFAGDLAVAKVGEIDVRVYLMWLAKKSNAAAQRRALSVLNRFFQWLVQGRRIQVNPVLPIERPPAVNVRPRCLRSDEIDMLGKAVEESAFPPLKDRDQAIISLMLNAGVRISELVSLNREDVDVAAGTIFVGVGRRRREIPLNMELRGVVERHLAHLPKEAEQPLFCNRKGKRLSKDGVYFLVTRYMRAAGIIDASRKASPKTLRHTFCATLLAKGASAVAVTELAGYSSLASTSIYSDISLEDKRKTVDLLTS